MSRSHEDKTRIDTPASRYASGWVIYDELSQTENHRRSPEPPATIPVNGKPIKARSLQMILWVAILAFLGAALVAGGYGNGLQTDWYVHVGPVYFHLFYLKHWWDHLLHFPSWVLYRHAYRDQGESAIAILLVAAFLVKPKNWTHKAGPVRTALSIPGLIILAFLLITGATWLHYFGLPDLWHIAFGARRINLGSPWPKLWGVAEVLIFGVIIGRILHKFWMPAGSTIQGWLVDRSVRLSRSWGNRTPLWVKYPIAPPPTRERWSWSESITPVTLDRDVSATHKAASHVVDILVALGMTVALWLLFSGVVWHFWIGTGHSFPYLAG